MSRAVGYQGAGNLGKPGPYPTADESRQPVQGRDRAFPRPGNQVDLVRQFRQLRALVIGDAMLDTYIEGTAARLCAEGPVPVVSKTTERRIPGGAANTAANLRALGAEVDFLSITGRDMAGTMLRSILRDAGIDDRWMVEDVTSPTLHKLRVLADGQYIVGPRVKRPPSFFFFKIRKYHNTHPTAN